MPVVVVVIVLAVKVTFGVLCRCPRCSSTASVLAVASKQSSCLTQDNYDNSPTDVNTDIITTAD